MSPTLACQDLTQSDDRADRPPTSKNLLRGWFIYFSSHLPFCSCQICTIDDGSRVSTHGSKVLPQSIATLRTAEQAKRDRPFTTPRPQTHQLLNGRAELISPDSPTSPSVSTSDGDRSPALVQAIKRTESQLVSILHTLPHHRHGPIFHLRRVPYQPYRHPAKFARPSVGE